MFAVCVAPDNEAHRSLTVNVLQGEQQEHRNMPLDEATAFIGRNFAKLIEKPGLPPPLAATAGAAPIPGGFIPIDIKTILGFLAENRPMSIMEYDKLIKFLVAKRESTLKDEYGTNIPAHLLLPPVGPNQVRCRETFSNQIISPESIIIILIKITGFTLIKRKVFKNIQ